jgi:hypothetical protein
MKNIIEKTVKEVRKLGLSVEKTAHEVSVRLDMAGVPHDIEGLPAPRVADYWEEKDTCKYYIAGHWLREAYVISWNRTAKQHRAYDRRTSQ